MIQGKWFAPGENLSEEILPLRAEIFGTRDAARQDFLGWNALIYEDGHPAASGRIWWEDGAFRLGDIGVKPDFRGRRLGDLTLRLLLFKAQSHAAKEVRLCCPESVSGFFARLGFAPESTPENGLVEMLLPGDSISLDSCANCAKADCPNRKGIL